MAKAKEDATKRKKAQGSEAKDGAAPKKGKAPDGKQAQGKPKAKASRVRSKANRIAKGLKRKDSNKSKRGVVYLAYLPAGFNEPQISRFFSQFGRVTRHKLFRSKKTGGSKGFAYVEFADEEVAKVVAHTMDKYRLDGKILSCKFFSTVLPHTFSGWRRKIKDMRPARRDKERKRVNSKPRVEVNGIEVPRTTTKVVEREASAASKRAKRLAELGVDFSFEDDAGGELAIDEFARPKRKRKGGNAGPEVWPESKVPEGAGPGLKEKRKKRKSS